MAITSVSDLQVYLPYIQTYAQRYTTENSALIKSGICATDPQIAQLVRESGAAGKEVALPFFNDLSGDDEGLAEGTSLTPKKITSGQDRAVIHRRGAAFSAYDLARAFTANDPVDATARLIAGYRNRMRQKMLLKTLDGMFADNLANDNGDLILDITGETGDDAVLNTDTILRAAQLLGDAKEKLTAIACHSRVELALNLLSGNSQTYKPASEQGAVLPSYNGKSIIMDDSVPFDADTGVATVYLFAGGAIAQEDALGQEIPLETQRDALASQTTLVERDFYIMHPRGFAWTGSVYSGQTPTHSEVANAANWNRVYDKKDARVCKLICKLA